MHTDEHNVTRAEEQLVLSTLERDQLAEAHNVRVPRRKLRGAEIIVLWSLRIYLIFMMAVVAYQIWSGAR